MSTLDHPGRIITEFEEATLACDRKNFVQLNRIPQSTFKVCTKGVVYREQSFDLQHIVVLHGPSPWPKEITPALRIQTLIVQPTDYSSW